MTRTKEPPGFHGLRALRPGQPAAQALRLTSARNVVELRVLAPDLFRVRAGRGRRLPERSSWAVEKTAWPPVEVHFQAGPREVVVATGAGELALNPYNGAWRLADRRGLEVFAAPPGASGFAAASPRIELALAERESLFGLGETTGTFNKRGLRRELWNLDVLGHASAIHPGLRSLYVAIPFLISLRDGRAAGLFWDNPARQHWDLGSRRSDRCQITADEGEIDLYLFLGPTLSEVVGRYTELTGRMPLPPRWALGYHQCRYSYPTSAAVVAIARAFRRKRIPCDALYLDLDHQDGYRVFTFGRSFPQPRAFLRGLRRMGFQVVTIVDPGVKDDPRFGLFRRGRRFEAFVKGPDGRRDYVGQVWPGRARFPDFLRAPVRAWWGREQARLQDLGVAGFWNDMNEPSDFAGPGKTLDPRCLHRTDQGRARHRQVHNLYGSAMARASREGALAHQPDSRPFIITRAGYAGLQRYALLWTGDNSSCWEHLADSLQMLLNLGLSGVAFCGSDVGGFLDDATGELLARWTQMAACTPFFRNHSNLGTRHQEPWAYGQEIEAICRRYIELRYQWLPYLYGLFVEAHRHGSPVMRPMAWHFQNDPAAVAAGDQFMLGPHLLVAPILRQGATARSVYLPSGHWFDYWTSELHRGRRHILAHADLATLPIFVRAGAIVPMGAVQQFVGETTTSTLSLHVWPRAPGQSLWYEDDGWSHAFTRGAFLEWRLTFRHRRRGGELELRPCHSCPAAGPAAPEPFVSRVERWRIVIHALRRPYRVSMNGKLVSGCFDPGAQTFSFEWANTEGHIQARWW